MKQFNQGSWFAVIEGVAVPTSKQFGNARLLRQTDNSITLHWATNFNLNGDFRTEEMTFLTSTRFGRFSQTRFAFDEQNKVERNAIRIANGLVPIK